MILLDYGGDMGSTGMLSFRPHAEYEGDLVNLPLKSLNANCKKTAVNAKKPVATKLAAAA